MNSQLLEVRSMRALLLTAALLGTASLGQASDQPQPHAASTRYPTMAAIVEYMPADQNAEISLARSAAPPALSRDATILVLGPHGYERAVTGTNGFVCVVERSWMNRFDSPEFWNPKMRSPVCLNPAAARSVLPYTIKRTEMVFAGLSKDQMLVRLKQAIESKEIPTLEPGAMSYMLSRRSNLGDSIGHWHPHLMFYAAKSDGADWGANLPGSPVLLDTQLLNEPEPLNTFLVPVSHWSDGSVASGH
jgi:hypothetical protein